MMETVITPVFDMRFYFHPTRHAGIAGAIALSALLLNACAGLEESAPRESGQPSAGESARKDACVSIADVTNRSTPPELYEHMVACARLGRYHEAASLFALAGSYTYYDVMRIADTGKHAAHTELIRENLAKLPADKKAELKDEIRKTLGSPDKLAAACRDVKRVGPPDYQPRYMANGGAVKSVDAGANWKIALDNFLHCPG